MDCTEHGRTAARDRLEDRADRKAVNRRPSYRKTHRHNTSPQHIGEVYGVLAATTLGSLASSVRISGAGRASRHWSATIYSECEPRRATTVTVRPGPQRTAHLDPGLRRRLPTAGLRRRLPTAGRRPPAAGRQRAAFRPRYPTEVKNRGPPSGRGGTSPAAAARDANSRKPAT
jgi:hypothetical protein